MRIIAHLTDFRDGHQEERGVDLRDDATILDLYNDLSKDLLFPVIAADRYYRVQNYSLYTSEDYIQYVISEGRVVWSPGTHEAKLSDFMATHDIRDNEIYMRFGRGGRGGGFTFYHAAWGEVLKTLAYGVTIIESGKYTIKTAIYIRKASIYIKGRLWNKWRPPYQLLNQAPGLVLSLIGQRGQWNASELAEMTGLPKRNAIFYLKGCGFRYDNQRHQYVATEATEEQFGRFNTMKVPYPSVDPLTTKPRKKPYARKRMTCYPKCDQAFCETSACQMVCA